VRRLWLLLACAPAVARAGDFIDTTITFIASDDNVRAGAGETIPSSPRFDFRPRTGNNLFFENYNRRNTGEETRTNLVLYKAFEGFFAHLTPEAAMVLEWDANRTSGDIANYESSANRKTFAGIKDRGSYLALNWDWGTPADPDQLQIVMFPFDSDKFRLGYSWELTWGGNDSFLLASRVPGVRATYTWSGGYAFVGGKTARAQTFTQEQDDPHANEEETLYAAMGGGGLWLGDHLQVELSGGYFDKGAIPIERGSLEGTPIRLYGVSGQITWADGIKPQRPVDTRLYRNPGTSKLSPRWKPSDSGWLIAAETSVVSQNLEDYENVGHATRKTGYAGDVNFQAKDGAWSFNADAVLRSLEFLVQDVPGLYPFSTTPTSVDTRPEFFAAAGADYYFSSARLQPGLTFGVQVPAMIAAKSTGADGQPVTARTVVRRTKNVLGESTLDLLNLPTDEDVLPVYSGQFTLRSDLSDLVTLVAEVQLSIDRNLTARDPEKGVRAFEDPYVLGVSFVAQAHF
jgi:hypothetical protein